MTATLTWQPFRLTLRSPFAAAHGAISAREGLLVRLRLSSGEQGLGEASPLPSFGGGSVEEASAALAELARSCRGLSIAEMWGTKATLKEYSPGSEAAARCGFETALADLVARRYRRPLFAWLAPEAGLNLPPERRTIPANAIIDASAADAAAEQARALANSGFTTFKVKVTADVDAACARLGAVREALGPQTVLRIDANGAWACADAAMAAIERLSIFGLSLCEQPLSPGAGIESLAVVNRRSPVPIAVDEGCRSLADLAAVARLGAAGTVVVKPMVTGLREALRMLRFARENGMAAIVTTTFDSGVGTALAAHLAALLPVPAPACGLATLEHVTRDIVTGAPPVQRGLITLGMAPGLGVALDEQALAALATGPACEAPL